VNVPRSNTPSGHEVLSMSDQFRLRLRILIGKPLTSKESSLTLNFEGRDVLVKSHVKDQPLSETTWIVLQVTGFPSEDAAAEFGERLRVAVEIAAFSVRLGTNTGQDKPTGWMSEEYARSIGMLKKDERIRPNVHGILVLPDDDNTRIPIFNATLFVTADPASFLDSLKDLTGSAIKTDAIRNGLRVLNLALMTPHPLAQLVLAFSAIEALGQNEKWTTAQTALIKKLAAEVEATANDNSETLEVANALRRGLHRIGLRQGVLRVLERIGQSALKNEWDRLYGLRSGIFHGTVPLSEPEANQLANDSITLCGKLIIALLASEGIKVPSIAKTHFV
jgi:hypothetical protein